MSEKLEVGSIVEGKVLRIKPFGAIVSINGTVQGLVHISQISNSVVQNINDHLAVGDTVKVKVLSVDEATNKISLSIKETLPPPQKTKQHNKFREQNVSANSKPYAPNAEPQEEKKAAPASDFEDKLKDWLKNANERQASLNKRINKR